ncbi:SYF2 splicing factor-domain-containing protein [Mycena olivaceomarginata]|nr:SYF2 splicing factor-domain-containing protein [Mycena olivaceomarginata]
MPAAPPKKKKEEEEEEEVVVEQTETDIVVDEEPSAPAAAAAPPPATSIPADTPPEPPAADDAMTGVETAAASAPAPTLTMEERKAKMDELRQKRAASHKANRASLITARDAARLEKQRKLAEMLRTKADAEERGEPDAWSARRTGKDLDQIKPDMVAYNRQKELAMGLAPGSLTAFNPTASSSQNLYRDANTLIYGDNKPSEDAIDRMVGKINKDIDKKSKFSRKRPNEDEGDITYINEHNRIARYYDKYTAEIRASFERGTAL